MAKWIRRQRMVTAAALLMEILLCGCTTILNGDLTVGYLAEEEDTGNELRNGVEAVMNCRDSICNSQMYDSEYPDAFYIPENYSKERQDIRGFELLDFVNGDTFIYVYQTMVYKDSGTASLLMSVSGDYVFFENSMTEDTRELSGEMVTVLAANRYTAQSQGEGYRELRRWSTEATDNQSFFTGVVGELGKGTGEQDVSIESYAIYFNGHAVVYQASEVREALKKDMIPNPLIEYRFFDVIQEITEEIMKGEGINPADRAQCQFDITEVSFSVGADHVDIYMTVTQSKAMQEEELAAEEETASQISSVSASSGEEEAVDESEYDMKSYEIHMGFYEMQQDFSCTIQNVNCDAQVEYFQKNGSDPPDDYEWNVSDNAVYFLTKEDVLKQYVSEYSHFFLENDRTADTFAHSEGTRVNDICLSEGFVIDGYRIAGRLKMIGQTERQAIRQGYYMNDGERMESDMRASFIQSRSFILEDPMVLAYSWERQRVWDERQYSRSFVMNGIRADYAVYLPEGDSKVQIELHDVSWTGRHYESNVWEEFVRWFTGKKAWDGCQRTDPLPAVNNIMGKVFHGKAYLFCYTQGGIYLFEIAHGVKNGELQFWVAGSFYLDYEKLRDSGTGNDFKSPAAVTEAGQKEYTVNDTAPDVYPDYSINNMSGLWTEDQVQESSWTLCTASSGLEIIKSTGEAYIPVFQKNVIYEYESGAETAAASYWQQLTRLEQGVAAYAVFGNPGEDRDQYPFLLLGYDYQGTVFTAMDIVRAKVIPFAIVEPGGEAAEEAWNRVTADPGESRVYYLKDCYDRSLYGTVVTVSGYRGE